MELQPQAEYLLWAAKANLGYYPKPIKALSQQWTPSPCSFQ